MKEVFEYDDSHTSYSTIASRMLCKGCYSISIFLAFSSVVVVVVVVCFLCFECCLKYSRDQKIDHCLHTTAIGKYSWAIDDCRSAYFRSQIL